MIATYRLTLKVFFKSFQGVFFAFAWPLLIMYILNSLFNTLPLPTGGESYINIICPGMIFISTFSVGLFGMTSTTMKLKESFILKRICVSPLSKIKFLSSLIITFALIQVVSSLWVFTCAYISFHNHGLILPVGFWFIFGWILSALLNITLSLLIIGNIKTQENAFSLTLLILIPSLFLSGAMFDIPSHKGLYYVSECMPQRHVYNLFFHGWQEGHKAFQGTGGHKLDAFKWLSVSISSIVIIFGITLKTFKWE